MVAEQDIEFAQVKGLSAEQLAIYLQKYRPRLKRIVEYRIHRLLQGRIDGSDVVQEALADAVRKLREEPELPGISLLTLLRRLTWLKLAEAHRKHLGTLQRDAHLDVSFHEGLVPAVNPSVVSANWHDSKLSSSQLAIAKETHEIIEKALTAMEPIDRELLVMKHFESMTISDISEVLGIPRSTAGRRYLAAVKRFQTVLNSYGEYGPD